MSSKYGEQMGNATRKGFSVLGNIGRIIGVFKEEATNVIQSSKKHR